VVRRRQCGAGIPAGTTLAFNLTYNDDLALITQQVTALAAAAKQVGIEAVKAEAAYLTAQQPALFQANPDVIVAWKKTLSGPPGSFASLTQYYMTPESWYLTS
jgi:hypothetical protein